VVASSLSVVVSSSSSAAAVHSVFFVLVTGSAFLVSQVDRVVAVVVLSDLIFLVVSSVSEDARW
jgi:hypothetical protein